MQELNYYQMLGYLENESYDKVLVNGISNKMLYSPLCWYNAD